LERSITKSAGPGINYLEGLRGELARQVFGTLERKVNTANAKYQAAGQYACGARV
jgi:hypothetical protein